MHLYLSYLTFAASDCFCTVLSLFLRCLCHYLWVIQAILLILLNVSVILIHFLLSVLRLNLPFKGLIRCQGWLSVCTWLTEFCELKFELGRMLNSLAVIQRVISSLWLHFLLSCWRDSRADSPKSPLMAPGGWRGTGWLGNSRSVNITVWGPWDTVSWFGQA